jgi:hypothetical protein
LAPLGYATILNSPYDEASFAEAAVRIAPLIRVFAVAAFGIAAISTASAFAPGPGALAAGHRAILPPAGEAAPFSAVKWKWKWKKQPPGWSHGRKTGWGGWGVPPGHLKKGWY